MSSFVASVSSGVIRSGTCCEEHCTRTDLFEALWRYDGQFLFLNLVGEAIRLAQQLIGMERPEATEGYGPGETV